MRKLLWALPGTDANTVGKTIGVPAEQIVLLTDYLPPSCDAEDPINVLFATRLFINKFEKGEIGCSIIANPYRWKEVTSPLYAHMKLNNIPTCLVERAWLGPAEEQSVYLMNGTLTKCDQFKELGYFVEDMTEEEIAEAKKIQTFYADNKIARLQQGRDSKFYSPDNSILLPMQIRWHDYSNNGYTCPTEEFYRTVISFANDCEKTIVIKPHPLAHKWEEAQVEEETYKSLITNNAKFYTISNGHIHDLMRACNVTVFLSNEKLIAEAAITGSIAVTCGSTALDGSGAFINASSMYDDDKVLSALYEAFELSEERHQQILEEQPKLLYYIVNRFQNEEVVKEWVVEQLSA